MKKTCFIFFFLFLSFNNYAQENSNWKWMHPFPQGNDIRFIKCLTASNWVAVGYTGTLMRTTNAGVNWLVYSNFFGTATGFLGQGKNIYGADFKDANTGIACGTQGYIARTINGGVTWDSLYSPAGTTALWNVSFADANNAYIGGNTGMVLKSTNGGQTWSTVTSPSGNANWSIFALDANTVFTVQNSGAIYKSSNGGSSWTFMSSSVSVALYGIYFFNANTGIVTGANGTARVTTNGGTNWNTPPIGSISTLKIVARKTPDELYVVGDPMNVFKSTDYGLTWTNINYNYPGQGILLASNTIGVTGNTLIVGGVNGLLNISTNGGTSWNAVSKVYNAGNVFDIDILPGGKVWAVGNPGTGGSNVLYSSNNGMTWTTQTNLTYYFRCIDMINDQYGWITGNSSYIYNTSNGGLNWNPVTIPNGIGYSVVTVEFVNQNTGWIFSYGSMAGGSIVKTTNGGSSWQQQDNSSVPDGVKWADMVDANTGYYITGSITDAKIVKTTNGGTNWIAQTSVPSPGVNLTMIKMVNANSGWVCGFSGIMWKTTDGTNWVQATAPGNNNYVSTDWFDMNNGFVGAGSGLVYRTTNGGSIWEFSNTGGSTVNMLQAVHPDTAWSTELFGFIHKYQRGTVNVSTWSNEVPDAYILKQNYPNPFNPSTTIEFAIPENGNVILNIYDINGKLVQKLVDNQNFNAGTLKIVFNASEFSSGVYFYSLFVNNRPIGTNKMILMK
jgi:photosystem II stability/assembly factor-like uncharacterized protein